ncbi:hypothetical protein LO771_06635 [Streptacidiphilus sp. ASG 303]|uniref:hypothetical protein n=1 Tax=Streptacidiphilus sp. ASG 303 TaxID=2896847 RepID=UPI001E587F3F|nr:hypothetical protein [Streptacidiphilus sp. ASG 303]MCD0482100.1 hypothetical protein [Streptacidiphilus sp. ASG 303]
MNQRRPHSRELNPEDLFRPDPDQPTHPQGGDGYGYPGPAGGPQPAQGAAWGAPPQTGAPDEAAAATQYLPPYPASPAPGGPGGSPDQAAATQYLPPYPGSPAPGGPEEGAAATQYLPPYPAGGPGGPGGAGGPAFAQHSAPTQPGFALPPQQPAAPYGGAPGGYLQQHLEDEPDGGPGGGGRRPSAKVIAGVVVGACALVGILAGALFGGGDGSDGKATAASSAPATGGSAASAPAAPASTNVPPAGADPAMQAQAQALAGLLGTASGSRGAVVAAVQSVGRCEDLAGARQRLIQASGQRQQLVAGLAGLQVDKLPQGPRLVERLRTAWEASARADREYAAWAADSAKSCRKRHTPAAGGHRAEGNTASGVATAAKKQAAALWNPIARRTGQPTRAYTDL